MRKDRLLIGRLLDDCCRNRGMTFIFLLSSLRGDNRGQAIFKLGNNNVNRKIPGIFLLCRKIGMTFICCLLSTTVHAECTPTLDCASIGYTETSCETTSLKCPFDTSKLKCISCDSSFRYTCSGGNIIAGIGDTCGGKYASCECTSGMIFENGSCVCDTSCKVGTIYYSDKTCSTCVVSGKTAIGIVVKDNELVMSQISSSTMTWASNTGTDTSLTNMKQMQAKVDMNGKSNTAVIVAAHPSDTSSNNAAKYCNTYTTAGTSAGDWYLPAAGELYSYVYSNYSVIYLTMTKLGWSRYYNNYVWSSSEIDSSTVWRVHNKGGTLGTTHKTDSGYVACFLAIN